MKRLCPGNAPPAERAVLARDVVALWSCSAPPAERPVLASFGGSAMKRLCTCIAPPAERAVLALLRNTPR